MKVQEVECKSIISESGLYGVDYSINPYIGCEHGCKYCYAKFMKEYTNHKKAWGEFVDVKKNSRNVLEDDLMKRKKGSILLSSVTDPYQPIEAEYKLTRRILSRLSDTSFPVTILTKSSLVLRDLDILKEFKQERLSVGVTLNFPDDKNREIWEPKSTPTEERVEALRTLSEEGINCYAHVGPYFEGITNLTDILKELDGTISELQIEDLNLRSARDTILETIRKNHPELIGRYEDIDNNPLPYQQRLREKTRKLEFEYDTPIRLFLG